MSRLVRSAAIALLAVAATGCGESAEAVHNAADAATGNQAVRESIRLKGEIQGLDAQHQERVRNAINAAHQR